eukprot:5554837-Prymnesium_polylepis.1
MSDFDVEIGVSSRTISRMLRRVGIGDHKPLALAPYSSGGDRGEGGARLPTYAEWRPGWLAGGRGVGTGKSRGRTRRRWSGSEAMAFGDG